MPSVSIIVPNYNHLRFLPQRLETIFNQTFQDFEVILLDDCSTDNSWEYLSQFANHPKVSHCIRNEVNSGSPFKQWKKGWDLAKYNWIWIAESDDYSELDFLERLVLQIDDEVSLIFVKSEFVDENGGALFFNGIKHEIKSYNLGENPIRRKGTQFISDFLVYRNYLLNASAVLFRNPKTFPEGALFMKYAGDWFFWLSILGFLDVIYLPRPRNFFRFHSGTTRMTLDEKSELRKFKECFRCIKLGMNISKKNFSFWKLNLSFSELTEAYFRLRYKYGRFRFYSILPQIPFFLYPLYYKFFIQSFIKSR